MNGNASALSLLIGLPWQDAFLLSLVWLGPYFHNYCFPYPLLCLFVSLSLCVISSSGNDMVALWRERHWYDVIYVLLSPLQTCRSLNRSRLTGKGDQQERTSAHWPLHWHARALTNTNASSVATRILSGKSVSISVSFVIICCEIGWSYSTDWTLGTTPYHTDICTRHIRVIIKPQCDRSHRRWCETSVCVCVCRCSTCDQLYEYEFV